MNTSYQKRKLKTPWRAWISGKEVFYRTYAHNEEEAIRVVREKYQVPEDLEVKVEEVEVNWWH